MNRNGVAEIDFFEEIPFPKTNSIMYREVYVLEQWLRRIAFAALMVKYGKDWQGALPNELCKELKARLAELKDRVYLDCENSSNSIWLTTLDELKTIIASDSIWPTVRDLTGYSRSVVSSKIDEMRRIRNTIGHNRAVSSRTITIWRGISASLKSGIETFKREFLYNPDTVLHMDEREEVIAATIFHSKMQGLKGDHPVTVFFESNYACSICRLPHEPFGYLRISDLVNHFHNLENSLLAILVNKGADEYSIVWPKIMSHGVCLSIIDKSLESLDLDTTSTPYEHQNPKYICNPIVWFYENQAPAKE